MRKAVLFAGVVAALSATSAFAESGFYAGAGVGQVSIQEEEDGLDLDASDTSFKVFGGYQVTEHFAVELSYIDGGTAEDTIQGVDIEISSDGVQGSLLGIVPIGDRFALYGRAGILSWEAELYASFGNSFLSETTEGEDFAWGVGGKFVVTPNLLVRVEFEGADLDGTDMRNVSAALAYSF